MSSILRDAVSLCARAVRAREARAPEVCFGDGDVRAGGADLVISLIVRNSFLLFSAKLIIGPISSLSCVSVKRTVFLIFNATMIEFSSKYFALIHVIDQKSQTC